MSGLTGGQDALLAALRGAVGRRHVLSGASATRRYRSGFRYGEGSALAVVRPGRLVELWRVLKICVERNAIVIMQAANTGLTGGSTPDGDDYDRDVVLINVMRLSGVHLVDEGRQAICLPGSTLDRLETMLKPLGREPHSVIGSSCIGASVIGGVCNNSGGALVRRGPAYTEMALFARVDAEGRLTLVNHLDVALGDDPEEMLRRLEAGAFEATDLLNGSGRRASDAGYADHVRDTGSDEPARYNADPGKLFEASGCAGRLAVFAVRLDTFAGPARTRTFYIGTNDPRELSDLRTHALDRFAELPISAEYIHRDAFDIAETYGKDMFLAIRTLGSRRIPLIFKAKSAIDRALAWFGPAFADRLTHGLLRRLPSHLPARMRQWRDRYRHHLLLKVADDGIDEARAYLASVFPSATGDFFECSDEEGTSAFLHRFAVAGAAVRYRAIHDADVEEIIALDVALRRNDRQWFELTEDRPDTILHALHYGHFFCHVFHQDYLVRKGEDSAALERALWDELDARGARYPAEHNIGHHYPITDTLEAFYRELDPRNMLNPGLGHSPRGADWS